MAPMKFEDKLREKLEERQLQPSVDAWNKLNEQLDDHQSKSNNKAYWWIGIAASLVGVLMLVTFLNKEVTEITPEPAIVDIEETINPIENPDNGLIEEVEEENTLKEVVPKRNKEAKSNRPNLKQQIKKEQQKLVPKNVEEAIAEVVKEETKQDPQSKAISFEEQKALEVVSKIRELQEKNSLVTDAEIDALLNVAQKEIELKKLYDEATNKVDANALLQSVENDLERSFRTRVFEMLQSGYKELKTAVAERNN